MYDYDKKHYSPSQVGDIFLSAHVLHILEFLMVILELQMTDTYIKIKTLPLEIDKMWFIKMGKCSLPQN